MEAALSSDSLIRRALWVSVPYNLGGAVIFAFPDSPLGQLAGLPAPVPMLDRVILALFVALFAGAYLWLARQPIIDRPMVGFAAIGKSAVFVTLILLWLMGEASWRGVVTAIGDAVLAGIFFSWLRRSGHGG